MREYNKRPENIARRKAYYSNPEIKSRILEEKATPEYRAKVKKLHDGILLKAKTIIARGKKECVCCGNKNFKFLQIDHVIPIRGIKNREDRLSFLRDIVNGKRDSSAYQLLCANCNSAKSDLKGCPIDHSLD